MAKAIDPKIQELRNYMTEMKDKDHPESQLISILHKAQALFGYLNQEVMDEVALAMNIPTAHIWGVATFYHYFNLKPKGEHTISVCLGTACYVKGADDLLNAVKEELKIKMGETTEDNLFTLQDTRCIGACGLAPVVMIDDKVYGELTTKKIVEIIRGFKKK